MRPVPKSPFSIRDTIIEALRNGPVMRTELVLQLAQFSRAENPYDSIKNQINYLRRRGQITQRGDGRLELVGGEA